MKTKVLIGLLSAKERKVFETTVIKNHKRNSLKKLYQQTKKKTELAKEKLYEQVFGEAFSEKKDALLRNEYRLLNRELELFLMETQWKKEQQLQFYENQLLLLRLYLEREEAGLFEQTWRKLYKKASNERRYAIKIALLQLFFKHQSTGAVLLQDVYEELRNLLKEGLQIISMEAMEQYKQMELNYLFTERVLEAIDEGHSYDLPATILSLNELEVPLENEDVVQCLDAMAKASISVGMERIILYEKALAHAAVLFEYEKYKPLAVKAVLAELTIGLEYFLLKEYDKADAVYTRALQKVNLLPKKSLGGIYYNYFSNLIFKGDYETALNWLNQTTLNWKEDPKTANRWQCLVAWTYILKGDYDTAFEVMQEPIERSEVHVHAYGRIVLAIIYYLSGEVELAEREVYNMLQSYRYKGAPSEMLNAWAQFFYKHLQYYHLVDQDKRHKKLKSLQEEQDHFYKENWRTASHLLFNWLKEQNQRLVTKRRHL